MNAIDKIRKRMNKDKEDLREYYVRDIVTLIREIDRLQKDSDAKGKIISQLDDKLVDLQQFCEIQRDQLLDE